MADKKALEMPHIFKSFSGVHALRDVSFNAYRGKVNVLMGENGSGVLILEDPQVAAAGDNPFLRTFLNAFCETLFGRGYGRGTYLVWYPYTSSSE